MPRVERLTISRAVLFAVPPLLTLALIINFCALIYQCGCHSWWAGAAAHCNIRQPGMKHCPWCAHGRLFFDAVIILILTPQFALGFGPSRLDWRWRVIAAILVFPVLGFVLAILPGLADGYWADI